MPGNHHNLIHAPIGRNNDRNFEIVEGHGFSRAERRSQQTALAAEVRKPQLAVIHATVLGDYCLHRISELEKWRLMCLHLLFRSSRV